MAEILIAAFAIVCSRGQQVRLDHSPALDVPDAIDDGLSECDFNCITRPCISGDRSVKRSIGFLILAPGERQTSSRCHGYPPRLSAHTGVGHRGLSCCTICRQYEVADSVNEARLLPVLRARAR